MIAGDHRFEPGILAAYGSMVPAANRPDLEVIAGHRCIFLDIVSAGAGGPDFRPTTHDRRRLAEELARAEVESQAALVFMHAYPGDLLADGEEVARTLADAGVAFVDTGHIPITTSCSTMAACSMARPARPARSRRAHRATPSPPFGVA